MIMDVIGMALFIAIYAYALSTEPLPHGDRPRPSRRLRTMVAHGATAPSPMMEMLP